MGGTGLLVGTVLRTGSPVWLVDVVGVRGAGVVNGTVCTGTVSFGAGAVRGTVCAGIVGLGATPVKGTVCTGTVSFGAGAVSGTVCLGIVGFGPSSVNGTVCGGTVDLGVADPSVGETARMADVTGEAVEPKWAYSPTPIPSSNTERAARNQTILELRMRFVSLKDGLCYWSSRARLGDRFEGAAARRQRAVRPPR